MSATASAKVWSKVRVMSAISAGRCEAMPRHELLEVTGTMTDWTCPATER